MNDGRILLNHGSGGRLTRELFDSLFGKYFANPVLDRRTDSAIVTAGNGQVAFTSDSFVVNPLFFPGGDIGKLAVCGTVNDLAVSGAKPVALSAAFILEEGFPLKDLERITASMAKTASEAGVAIVTGDTKVVSRGQADGCFITTSGIGVIDTERAAIGTAEKVKKGDLIITNGYLGDHGMAILAARKGLPFSTGLESDCAALNGLIADVLDTCGTVSFMRDATRGGAGTVLCELAETCNLGIEIDESSVPVRNSVRGMCDMFGFDPLFIANEGKVVLTIQQEESRQALAVMRKHPLGKESVIIGRVVEDHPRMVTMKTAIGGSRIVNMPAGDQLPRIC